MNGGCCCQKNRKRELIYEFRRRDKDSRLVFAVAYSERGRKTKAEDILAAIRRTGAALDQDTLERAFRVFEAPARALYENLHGQEEPTRAVIYTFPLTQPAHQSG